MPEPPSDAPEGPPFFAEDMGTHWSRADSPFIGNLILVLGFLFALVVLLRLL